MIKGLLNWKLRAEIDRLEVFFWLSAFFTALAHLSAFKSFNLFIILILTLMWPALFRLLYLSFNRLYYTLWTVLVFIIALNLLVYFPLESKSFFGPRFFSTLAALNLSAFAYLMFTPIYYPIVSWWEYDFRFRDEVKATVIKNENKFESRLSDVRRKAACLQCFENFNAGELIKLDLPHGRSFDVEIMSKRTPSLGRPTVYGVRFVLDHSNGREFELFCHEWKTDKVVKQKLKRGE